MQGPSGKNINIYEAINTTANSGSTSANKYTTATTGSAQLVTQYVSKNADIFISCSGSPAQIYAVKFTPETITSPSISQEGNTVTITAGTSNASSYGATVTTYYTIDGTDPTSSSTAYTAPFDVTEACTVKAITISNGGTSSTVASQQCTFTPTVVNSVVTFESTVTGGSITVKNGDETVASASEIASGTTLTVIVTPSNGYAFGSLSITKTSNSETITPTQDQVDATKYTFTMPTEAVSISATFTIPVWTVNNQANGDITTKTAVDNVYLHQKSGRKSTVADAGAQTLTQFTNGTVHGATKKLTIQGAAEYSSQTGVTTDYISNAMTNRNTADADIDRDFLALDVTEAGILYVIYKPNDNANTRNVYVGFQKASDNSYTKTIQSASIGKVQTEIKHSANGAGTFFIYSSIATEIYAIMFVPETVKTLTTVASPADGGIIKVTNGNATYEGAANGLAVESNTALTLEATANTGYNFTGWSENVTSGSVTMDDDKTVTATFEPITYPLTITQPETGGSITATVDETSYSESTNVLENKTVTLSAAPADGYQLVGWTDGTNALGDLPKSLVNTITMTEAKTATATFEAIPTVAGVTEESVWTFDGFAANTILSDKTVYGYNNGKGTLYISGHSTNGSITAAAKVVAGNMTEGQVVGTGEAVQPEKCLQLQGGDISSLAVSRTANSFTSDAIAFQAGVPGTVYVLMSGGYKTGETRSINIAANKSETDNTKKAIYSTTLIEGDPVQVVSCEIAEASSVFIGTSGGGKNIYAVKFVPAPTYAVTIPAVEHGSAGADKTNAAAGETVTLTVTPATGYMVDKVIVKNGEADIDVTTVTENQTYSFVMPAAAPTITVSFKENHTKIWDFSDWNANDEITTVTGKNGLYYRGGTDTRKLTVSANTSALTWNFPDGFAYQRSSGSAGGNNLILKGNGNLNIAGTLTPDTEADNTNNLTLAFTTTEAGTVYVAYRIVSGKNANLYYKSSTGENYDVVATGSADDNNNRQGVLFYTAPSGGTFFIGGNGDMNVYMIKFEPAETVYTLTETANPAEGGSVKKEIVYGDTPNYYETLATTFLSGTELRLTPAPAVGYGFSYWGDTPTDTDASKTITMTADQNVKVNFSEVKHQITVASAENGTVGLQVGGESVTLTDGKADIGEGAEVTVVTTPTLFYGVKDIKVTKTGDANTTVEVTNGKFTVPAYDVTVTVTFQEEKKYSSTDARTWNFVAADDAVTTTVDYGDGMYLRAASAQKGYTKVESGSVTSVTLAGESVAISHALQTAATFDAPDAGNTSATAVSPLKATSGTAMIALNADTKGTVYVAASPVADGSGQIRIYFSDGTGVPVQKVNPSIPSKDEVYTASYATDVPGTFYLGTTVAANIYAVKFVPTVTYAISKSEMTNGDVTIELATATAGQTVTLTVTPSDGYRLKSGTLKATYIDGESQQQTLAIENNQFTMPAYAVTVSAEFEAIPAVYGTYDFRSFAKANLEVDGAASIGKTEGNVMTGSFTGITNTMTLKDAFGISYNAADKEIKLVRGADETTTGVAIPRGSAGQVGFYMYGLKAGDWFKVETGEVPLYINKVNDGATIYFYDIDDTSKTNVARNSEIVSGHTYVASQDITSMELNYNTSNTGNIYLYSAQLSNGDAVPSPTIGSYDFTTGMVEITANNSLKGNAPTAIYYTTDGTDPTNVMDNDHKYTGAIALTEATTIKAVAVLGDIQSTVAEKLVELETVTTPTVGELTDGKVTITAGSSNNPSATTKTTYYTLDGSEPTTENNDGSFTEASKAIEIDQTRWLKTVTISSTGVSSDVKAQKVVVDAATPSTVIDFVKDVTELKYGKENLLMYYYYNDGDTNEAKYNKSNAKFNYIVNPEVHTRLAVLSSDQNAVSCTADGLKVLNNGRPIAINDLHAGDKVYVTYTSTSNMKTAIYPDRGDVVTIGGTDVESKDTEIESGQEVVVKTVSTDYNYLMLMPVKDMIITKIEINPAFTLTKGTIDPDITNVQIKVGNGGYENLGDSKIIAKGSTVTLQATYSSTNKNLVWQDGDGNPLTANENGTLTLTMDEDMTIKAVLTTGITVTNSEYERKLNNGLIEVTIENNGRITAIKDLTTDKEVMTSTDANQRGYFNFNYRPSQTGSVIDFGLECKSSGSIVQKGSSGDSQIELIYPMADAATESHQTWKIGYVMKAGVRGIYTYAIMDGSSSYSELHEARYGWRVNPTIFNYAWVSDTQQGAMPTPAQIANPTETLQDATFKLNDNTIYTKYDWANFVKDDQLHGIMGDGIGAWLISPSTEWVNGGPTKQELTVHATETTPIILQTMHSRHFGAAAAVLGSSDKKMFGPCLFYVNSGLSQEAMIEDAKAKATAEVNAWPYAWFTNNDDIKSGLALTAAERGSVTGTVNISGTFVTDKVQVVLTQGNKKPLLDGNGYQYYTEATVGSEFTIANVRPGTYTLYVYALNGDATGTYKKENVTVNAGANDLGTISWTPDKLGVTLWRIGEADHSTKGFKLSNETRRYGLWDYVPTDLTYTIGTSTEANDWYYAQVKNGGNWKINFNNTESYTKPLKLTIATAGAARAPKLEVMLNDKLLNTNGSYVFSNDAAIYRSGVLSGRDSLIVIDVPAAYMQVGQNTLNLKVSGLDSGVGGIMYDCIKLEDGSDVSEVIYDFRTWAEANMSKNGDDHQATIVRDDNGVLTGSFTAATGETVNGTMTLNGKFSIVGSSTDNINGFKLRKKGTDNNAGSGLLFPRCSIGQSDFIINNLNPGEWFKLDAHASYHLQFAEANANVTQLGRTETVTGTTEIIPGTVYKVKDDATGPVSVKICNALSGGGQSFIYSVTISSGEAISEPTISELSGGKVTIAGGASTKGGTVKTFYTIDGSTPTSSSAEYTAAVAIDQTRIVKAVTINTTTGIASNVVTKKIKVDAATPATVWDFKNDATLKPLTYADETYNGCYVNTSNQDKSDGKFKYVTGEKIHAKLSWQIEGSETANATVGNTGLAITKGGRAFAINDLHVGDKIYITYSNTGDTPLKTSICAGNRGCAISVNGGATVTSGNTTSIASGDEIEIKSTPEGYEYLVLMPTDNKITITKIEINQHVIPEIVPSTPAVYNIAETVAKGDTLAFSQTGVSVYNMEKSGNNWELKSRSDFYPVTNFSNKVSVRVGSNSLTYNMTAGTMQLRRAMAIHDLSEGDEIVILYSGEGSLINVNSDRSDAFTVGGKTVAAGEEISSGATIKITKTQEDNNYIVVNTSGTVYLQAIYVNTKAPTMVIRPKIELTEVGTTTATYRITYEEGARLYYILAKEGEEHRVSTTGTYDFTIEESDRIKAWATRSGITSDTLSTVIYAPTPAPSESGDYDFFEQANELPADLEVTLDPSKQVTVGGQTLYKPTAMTAQTFNNKFAFTETNTTGKIKIRTNRTLVFNKGTNMNMALLNMKRGDIISFDYKGTITFANTSVIRKETSGVAGARGMTRAESDELESGAAYVVQQDGDVLLNLSLSEEALSIAKMYVASAPGKSKAAAIDFATAAEEEEELDQGGAAGVWCHEREAMIKFLRFTNQSDELPINNKVSSENGYGANSTNGFTSGNRNIAIHNLAKGDTIKVRFAGGAMMYYGHKSYGNRVSVNGQLLQPGDTIHSGDVLKVEQVDYLNNYVVLRIGSKAAISGIFINTLETEKVLMPTITPKSSNTFLITSGVSTVGNEVGSIYTLNGTDPSMVNGTGGPYESFEIQVVRGEEMTIKAMSYSSSGMVSRITTLYYNGSDLTPIESIKMDENGQADGETVIYDLQGRRVNDLRPGNIYIINGKKVLYKRR